jgi:hypothetical protein
VEDRIFVSSRNVCPVPEKVWLWNNHCKLPQNGGKIPLLIKSIHNYNEIYLGLIVTGDNSIEEDVMKQLVLTIKLTVHNEKIF